MFESSLLFMLIMLLILLLLSNAVTVKREKSVLFGRIVMQNIASILFISYGNLYINSLAKGIGIYGGLFHVTIFTQTFNIFILFISLLILSLNSFFPRKLYNCNISSLYKSIKFYLSYDRNAVSNKTSQQFRIIEYPLIIVFILSGASFLISTNDLVSIFLSIELQSYGLYILSTLYKDSERATASGLTYFLLGGLSSCFILLGSALLYINSGTTGLENIYVITSLSEIFNSSTWYQPYYLHLSLIILSTGFLFKISAAPFHFWSPDVYDGIPTIVTTYVAIIAKISIFAFFLELVYYTDHVILEFTWKNVLLISSLLSLIVGSVLGLTQFRIKRLYAYSTINHVGFLLLALSINSAESIQSYIFYILQYSLVNLNAFILLITIAFSLYGYIHNVNNNANKNNKVNNLQYLNNNLESTNNMQGMSDGMQNNNNNLQDKNNSLQDKDNSPIQLINQVKGYFYINPFIATSLSITLFSFAGIPPIVGFFGKQMVLSAALDSGYIFMAIIGILTSVISAGYYLSVIKDIFFFKSEYTKNPFITKTENHLISLPISWPLYGKTVVWPEKINNTEIILNGSLTTLISILTMIIILFIFVPEESFNLVNIVTLTIFKT